MNFDNEIVIKNEVLWKNDFINFSNYINNISNIYKSPKSTQQEHVPFFSAFFSFKIGTVLYKEVTVTSVKGSSGSIVFYSS